MLQQLTRENFDSMLGMYSTGELEAVLLKTPWFQQAHVLLAKKYQLENNPKFDRQLQLAALYTQDRELLFRIFRESPVPVQAEPVEAGSERFVKPEPEQLPVIEDTAPVEQTVQPLAGELPIVEVKPEVEAVARDSREKNLSHSFDEWLKVFSSEAAQGLKAEEKSAGEMDEELNRTMLQNLPFDYLQDKMEEETHYSKGLDRFIEEQIEKRKYDSVKRLPADELDPGLVTETIARVYEMQKKYHRAIKAYETLSLKIPEKSDYFAARINYLKSII